MCVCVCVCVCVGGGGGGVIKRSRRFKEKKKILKINPRGANIGP